MENQLIVLNQKCVRPYIGTYLGIEEPNPKPVPAFKTCLIEFELHILRTDLSVRIVTLIAPSDSWGNEPEHYALQHIAWVDSEALAFTIYKSRWDGTINVFDRKPDSNGSVGLRTGKIEWTWFNHRTNTKRASFTPDYLEKYRK